MKQELFEYKVVLSRDEETENFDVKVPALGIADFGSTVEEALQHIQDMIIFHLECLVEEGESIPKEKPGGDGLFIRVKAPVHAA